MGIVLRIAREEKKGINNIFWKRNIRDPIHIFYNLHIMAVDFIFMLHYNCSIIVAENHKVDKLLRPTGLLSIFFLIKRVVITKKRQ